MLRTGCGKYADGLMEQNKKKNAASGSQAGCGNSFQGERSINVFYFQDCSFTNMLVSVFPKVSSFQRIPSSASSSSVSSDDGT